MQTAWIFGDTRPLGVSISKHLLNRGLRVVGFARSDKKFEHENYIHHALDLSDELAVGQRVLEPLQQDCPSALIFCLRSRALGKNEAEAIKTGLDLEILLPLTIYKHLRELGSNHPSQFLFFSSGAAKQVHPDLNFCYHLLKESTLSLSRYISVTGHDVHIRSNCIVLGEFLKYDLSMYKPHEIEKFNRISQLSTNHTLCTLKDINQAVDFFVQADSLFINGQNIYLDGGLTDTSLESITRMAKNQ